MPNLSQPQWRGLKRIAALAVAASCVLATAQQPAAPVPSEAPALNGLIREAMLYAYPYQEFMKLRQAALHDKNGSTYTTLNTFRHARQLATPKDRWANAPINDTFYSTNWLASDQDPAVVQGALQVYTQRVAKPLPTQEALVYAEHMARLQLTLNQLKAKP